MESLIISDKIGSWLSVIVKGVLYFWRLPKVSLLNWSLFLKRGTLTFNFTFHFEYADGERNSGTVVGRLRKTLFGWPLRVGIDHYKFFKFFNFWETRFSLNSYKYDSGSLFSIVPALKNYFLIFSHPPSFRYPNVNRLKRITSWKFDRIWSRGLGNFTSKPRKYRKTEKERNKIRCIFFTKRHEKDFRPLNPHRHKKNY